MVFHLGRNPDFRNAFEKVIGFGSEMMPPVGWFSYRLIRIIKWYEVNFLPGGGPTMMAGWQPDVDSHRESKTLL